MNHIRVFQGKNQLFSVISIAGLCEKIVFRYRAVYLYGSDTVNSKSFASRVGFELSGESNYSMKLLFHPLLLVEVISRF